MIDCDGYFNSLYLIVDIYINDDNYCSTCLQSVYLKLLLLILLLRQGNSYSINPAQY